MEKKKNIKSVSGAVGFGMHKSKGQHLLKNPQILNDIVNKSNIKPTETVLEIGPGTGNLTMLLLEKAKKVYAIELDPRMVAQLTKRVGVSEYQNKLVLRHGDILKEALPSFDVCVANIPYQISSGIVFKLLAHRPLFRAAVLLIQREFAMRLIAKPNSEFYCRLSVNVQLLSKVEHLMKVGKNNFVPPPKVESAVVKIEPKSNIPDINYTEWDGLLRLCFSRKNKTLGAIFKQKKILDMVYSNFMKTKNQGNNIPQQGKGSVQMLCDIDMDKDIDEDMKDDDKDESDDGMEDDDDKNDEVAEGKGKKQKDSQKEEFKKYVMDLLTQNQFVDKRASKMDIDSFLNLLNIFNTAGIHFS